MKEIEQIAEKKAIITYKVTTDKNRNKFLSAYISGYATPKIKRRIDRIKISSNSEKDIETLKHNFNRNLSFHKGVRSTLYNAEMPNTKSVFLHRIGRSPKSIRGGYEASQSQYIVTANVYVNGRKLTKTFTARSKKISKGGTKDEAIRHLKGIVVNQGYAKYDDAISFKNVKFEYETFL